MVYYSHMIPHDQLIDILKTIPSLTAEQQLSYIRDANEKGLPLERYLIQEGITSESVLYQAWAKALSLPFSTCDDISIPLPLCTILSRAVAQTHETVPFGQTDKTILVATARPYDTPFFQSLERLTKSAVQITVTTPNAIQQLTEQCVQPLKADIAKLNTIHNQTAKATALPDGSAGFEQPIIRLVETVADHALLERASDIHIEPTEKDLRVRYRVDGLLRDVMHLPLSSHAGVLARLKILSHLKLDEHRLPQDGRFALKTDSGQTTVRLSILPTYYGEKAVLRLLREGARPLTLEALGFLPDDQDRIHRAISSPHGMILVSGPTGSGKTTTLYTVLSILNQPQVNICTIEDPIEYKLDHITQSQVQPVIGFTFAAGLRALLRQDPNIIMVGEIRDEETASIAINSAMTGHLLLSTIHTNSALGAIARLTDIGIPTFLIASTTRLLLGQRLVRKLCANCKKSIELPAETLKDLSASVSEERLKEILVTTKVIKDIHEPYHANWQTSVGCDQCAHEGFAGRLGIYEIISLSENLRQAIRQNASELELATIAKQAGSRTMLEDGIIKAAQGLTTIEEVLRATRET